MAFVIADRVRETTTTIGTGSVTLGGAYTSFQTFSAAIGNGNNTYYTIASASSGEWEVGIGTYASGGNLLSRDTVLSSSNAGNLVNFSVGSKDVFVTQPSKRSLLINSGSTGLFAGNAAFTANGIPYANSTTTLTTGSALTYNGTTLTADTASTSAANFRIENGSFNRVGAFQLTVNGVQFDAFDQNSTSAQRSFIWLSGGSEQMRLTSTGLGIGTSSPGAKLDVNGGTNSEMRLTTSGSGYLQIGQFTNGAFIGTSSSDATAGQLRLGTGGAAQVWLSTAGNLGIGTSSPGARLQLQQAGGARARFSDSKNTVAIGSVEEAGDSAIGFFTQTTTERMRLDSSGNLGIGTSSPDAKLDVTSAGSAATYTVSAVIQDGTYPASGNPTLEFNGFIGGNGYRSGIGSIGGQQLAFYTPSTFGVAPTRHMTLTELGNLGIGTSSPAYKLQTVGQAYFGTVGGTIQLRFGNDTAANYWGIGRDNVSTGDLVFQGQTTEYMRLTASGNLGIGTSSPGAKLEVSGSNANSVGVRVTNSSQTSQLLSLAMAGSSGHGVPGWDNSGIVEAVADAVGSGTRALYLSAYNGPMLFATNGRVERMRLDSSGNLGLGVTPVVGYGTSVQLKPVGGGATAAFLMQAVNTDDHRLYVTNNALPPAGGFTGGFNYTLSNASATAYLSVAGQHRWLIAPPGTAGNAITFTQAMTLDASGNLGVGITSPTATLHVKGGNTNNLKVDNGGQQYTEVDWLNNGTIKAVAYWDNTNAQFLISAQAASSSLAFGTVGSERARIDSSGNFLVGKTAANTTTAGNMITASYMSSAGTQDYWLAYNTTAAAYRFYVTAAGTVFATNTTISAISDQRFKENIRDLDDGLSAIMALKPRKFDWKAGKGKDIKDDRGFVAQEFEQVFPDMIDEWKDPAPEGEEPYKAVRADLIPVLVKAIQELKAEFDEYKATHP